MRDELLTYYERELTFVRQHGGASSPRSTRRSPAGSARAPASPRTRTSSG